MMQPGERLDSAEAVFETVNLEGNEQNYVCLQALLAIGRLLQNIDDRQAAAVPPAGP